MQNKEQKYIAFPVEQVEEIGQYLLKLPAGQVLKFIGYIQSAPEGIPIPMSVGGQSIPVTAATAPTTETETSGSGPA